MTTTTPTESEALVQRIARMSTSGELIPSGDAGGSLDLLILAARELNPPEPEKRPLELCEVTTVPRPNYVCLKISGKVQPSDKLRILGGVEDLLETLGYPYRFVPFV